MQIEENDVIIDLIAFDEITFAKRNNTQVQIGGHSLHSSKKIQEIQSADEDHSV